MEPSSSVWGLTFSGSVSSLPSLLHYQGPLQQSEKSLLYSEKNSRQTEHIQSVKYTGKLIDLLLWMHSDKKTRKGGRFPAMKE